MNQQLRILLTSFAFMNFAPLMAMQEPQPRKIAIYDSSAAFNALTYEKRWEEYNGLTNVVCDQNASINELEKQLLEMKELRRRNAWKVGAITFVCTAVSVGVLVKLIDKKKQ